MIMMVMATTTTTTPITILMRYWTYEKKQEEIKKKSYKQISIMLLNCLARLLSAVRHPHITFLRLCRWRMSICCTGSSSKELDYLISSQPRTKEDFQELSNKIIEYIIKRHQNKPLYPTFVEYHVRELSAPLKDVEVRKASSALTTLANEKQKEQREKTIGKKKTKGATKPVLGSAKANRYLWYWYPCFWIWLMICDTSRVDTNLYDEALDDFGNDPNDFM